MLGRSEEQQSHTRRMKLCSHVPYLQLLVSLVHQASEMEGQVSGERVQVLRWRFTSFQPLKVQNILLIVSDLWNKGGREQTVSFPQSWDFTACQNACCFAPPGCETRWLPWCQNLASGSSRCTPPFPHTVNEERIKSCECDWCIYI